MRIRKTNVFKKWLKKLNDSRARHRINIRIKRLEEGNYGDVKHTGEGVIEMRINYGQGYRVYFKETGNEIIILLCGGDKSTQQEDIAKAKKIAIMPLEEEEE